MAARTKVATALLGMAALVPAELALERLDAFPKAQVVRSGYLGLRNQDLKRAGVRLAGRLRAQAARARLREIDALVSGRGRMPPFIREDSTVLREAMQLRDEILQRMPKSKRPDLPYGAFELAHSAEMIEEAADVLETLAKLLPAMWYRDEEWRAPAAPVSPGRTLVA